MIRPEHANSAPVSVSTEIRNGSVSREQPQDASPSARAKRRPRGASFTPERAREVALARETRRREARRLAAERGEQTETTREVRDIVAGPVAPRMSDPRVELPALSLGDLVEVNGVLVMPAAETGGGGTGTGYAVPRSEAIVAPRPGQSPSRGDSGVACELRPLASVTEAPDRPSATQEAAPAAPGAVAAAEQERQRVEQARVALATLRYRLQRPEMARHMLPWSPPCPSEGGKCRGCGRTLPAWARAGHAVEMADKGRERCVAWALGLPPA